IRTDPLAEVLTEIPAVAAADVSVGLPGTVTVDIRERRPILVWRFDDRRWSFADTGLLFAEARASPPGDLAGLPVISDDRLTSRALRVGSMLGPVHPHVATPLGVRH